MRFRSPYGSKCPVRAPGVFIPRQVSAVGTSEGAEKGWEHRQRKTEAPSAHAGRLLRENGWKFGRSSSNWTPLTNSNHPTHTLVVHNYDDRWLHKEGRGLQERVIARGSTREGLANHLEYFHGKKDDVQAVGTSEGAKHGWDTRGRGRADQPSMPRTLSRPDLPASVPEGTMNVLSFLSKEEGANAVREAVVDGKVCEALTLHRNVTLYHGTAGENASPILRGGLQPQEGFGFSKASWLGPKDEAVAWAATNAGDRPGKLFAVVLERGQTLYRFAGNDGVFVTSRIPPGNLRTQGNYDEDEKLVKAATISSHGTSEGVQKAWETRARGKAKELAYKMLDLHNMIKSDSSRPLYWLQELHKGLSSHPNADKNVMAQVAKDLQKAAVASGKAGAAYRDNALAGLHSVLVKMLGSVALRQSRAIGVAAGGPGSGRRKGFGEGDLVRVKSREGMRGRVKAVSPHGWAYVKLTEHSKSGWFHPDDVEHVDFGFSVTAYGTSEGAEHGWDTRGRGRHHVPSEGGKRNAKSVASVAEAFTNAYGKPLLPALERLSKKLTELGASASVLAGLRIRSIQDAAKEGVPIPKPRAGQGLFVAVGAFYHVANSTLYINPQSVTLAADTAHELGHFLEDKHLAFFGDLGRTVPAGLKDRVQAMEREYAAEKVKAQKGDGYYESDDYALASKHEWFAEIGKQYMNSVHAREIFDSNFPATVAMIRHALGISLNVQAYGTSEGAKHGWDTRGRGQKDAPVDARIARAKAAYNPATAEKQRVADAMEIKVAALLGGQRTPNNSAFDVLRLQSKAAVEVKTLIDAKVDKITMRKECRLRKLETAKQEGFQKVFTVAIDVRNGKPTYYVKQGVGSFRLEGMSKVSESALRKLLK